MSTRMLTVLFRSALLVAIFASAALFVDYRAAEPAFCGVTSGCAQVKASPLSSIFGIPLPHIGLGVFVGLFAFSLSASQRSHLYGLALFTWPVALGALGLIGMQLFWIGAICKWCMAVDVSAVVAAGAVWGLLKREPDAEPRMPRMVWGLAAVVGVAAPLLFGGAHGSVELPAGVTAKLVPGKVNIVTFTDFECPHCRNLHPVIDEVSKLHEGRIAVTRMMYPLKSHPGATPAAHAYVCTPEGKRAEMTDALYSAKSAVLTRSGLLVLAKDKGLDVDSFAKCYESKETRERIEAESKVFKDAGMRGIPATFVQSELIEGANVDAFLAAVDRSLTGGGIDPTWMFVLFAAAGLAAAGVGLRASST
jgi:protein-disulfide isomerase